MKTIDGGDNWFHADSGMSVNGERLVRVIEFDPAYPETLFAGVSGLSGGDLYRTTNGGESWTSVAAPGLYGGVLSLAIDSFNPNRIYAGTGYNGLFKSTDGGSTWESSLDVTTGVFGIGIDPVDSDILYACVGTSGSGFYRSSDGGSTWAVATTGMPPNTSGANIRVNRASRDIFVVVFPDSVGLFKSTDLGFSWTRLNGLNSETWVTDLTISPDQIQLYVGFDSLGVYRTTVVVTDIATDQGQLPDEIEMLQNYPNPFNPTTTIKYDLQTTSPVSLKVYDVLGKEIKSLVNGIQAAGNHRITFDASEFSSGVYFYRLKAGNFVETKKMVLAK